MSNGAQSSRPTRRGLQPLHCSDASDETLCLLAWQREAASTPYTNELRFLASGTRKNLNSFWRCKPVPTIITHMKTILPTSVLSPLLVCLTLLGAKTFANAAPGFEAGEGVVV